MREVKSAQKLVPQSGNSTLPHREVFRSLLLDGMELSRLRMQVDTFEASQNEED